MMMFYGCLFLIASIFSLRLKANCSIELEGRAGTVGLRREGRYGMKLSFGIGVGNLCSTSQLSISIFTKI